MAEVRAADLPEGSVVATRDEVFMARPRFGWKLDLRWSGSRSLDDAGMDAVLAGGAEVLRHGYGTASNPGSIEPQLSPTDRQRIAALLRKRTSGVTTWQAMAWLGIDKELGGNVRTETPVRLFLDQLVSVGLATRHPAKTQWARTFYTWNRPEGSS